MEGQSNWNFHFVNEQSIILQEKFKATMVTIFQEIWDVQNLRLIYRCTNPWLLTYVWIIFLILISVKIECARACLKTMMVMITIKYAYRRSIALCSSVRETTSNRIFVNRIRHIKRNPFNISHPPVSSSSFSFYNLHLAFLLSLPHFVFSSQSHFLW